MVGGGASARGRVGNPWFLPRPPPPDLSQMFPVSPRARPRSLKARKKKNHPKKTEPGTAVRFLSQALEHNCEKKPRRFIAPAASK